jgi:glycosyltransferase involved in cell wall biosynthesis
VLGYLLAALDPDIEVRLVATNAGVLEHLVGARPGSRADLLPPLIDKRDGRAFLRHRRFFSRARPDVVHFNLRSLWSCQYAIVAALSVRGPAVVAVEHSPLASESGTSRALKRWTSRRLAAHVTVGVRVAAIIEDLASVPRGSMRVIPNGVPVPDAVPSAPAADLPFTVATVARLDRWKGVDVLLRAAAQMGDGVRVVVVGEGEERDALRDLGQELGLGDRLELRGWRDGAMAEVASTGHVFVLPSRLEAFPLTVLEAMAWGVPVVATDVGSTSEVVRDGLTGHLVAPDDVDGLAAALRAMRDPTHRDALRVGARELVVEQFTAAAMARRYEALFDEITERRSPR